MPKRKHSTSSTSQEPPKKRKKQASSSSSSSSSSSISSLSSISSDKPKTRRQKPKPKKQKSKGSNQVDKHVNMKEDMKEDEIMTDVPQVKKQKKVLPLWMQSNIVFPDENLALQNDALRGLDDRLVETLHEELNVDTLFPVQRAVIPKLLYGCNASGDVCVCAPTGSGKTLAYAIPIVQVWYMFFVYVRTCLVVLYRG